LDASRKLPVTWITGPAGSGKTTLVSSYLESSDVPCLWYYADEGDGDPGNLFYYLSLCARKLSRKRTPLPLLTPEYLQGLVTFTLRYFENLYSRVKAPFVMVLDNYQRIPSDSVTHEIIRNALGAMPEGMNAFVVSRSRPPSVFSRLYANSRMRLVEYEDLRFTFTETRKVVALQAGRTKFSRESIASLHQATDGWAAGVVLMTEAMKRQGATFHPRTLTTDEIIDYFGAELFSHLDEDVRDFLLRTAFLPTVTVKTAEKLTDSTKANEILSMLHRDNYFTERSGQVEAIYRYHPLFREFLLSVAQTRFSPEEVRTIEREGARALLDLGQKEEAVDLLIAAKDWVTLVPAILNQAPALVSAGRSKTLEGWIGSLPEEIRSGSGWLLYWRAVCRQPYDPEESRLLFDRSFTLSNQTGDTACALLAWSGAAMSIFYKQGQLQPFDPLIDWLDAFIASGESFPSPDIEAAVACGMMAALLGIRLHHPEFRTWVDRAVMLSRSVANASLRLQICYIAACCYMCLGDHGPWAMVVAEMEEMAKSREPLQAILWRHMKANTLNQMGPFDESPFPFIEEGLKISSESGVVAWVPMLLFEGCQGALDRGDFRKAADFLVQLESMLGRAPKPFVLRYHDAAAFYYLGTGDTRRAVTHAQQAITFSPVDVAFVPAAAAYLCSAMILVAVGRHDGAREHIAAYRRLPRTPSRILEYTSLVAEAVLALDEGAPDALDIISRSFRIGREEGYMTPFYCWIPSLMSRLCSVALKAGIEVEYARTMIRTRGLVPEEPSADEASWPWPTRIFTLGRFEILIEDKPIDITRLQKKPLLLLKALIALGGERVREETLSELLWPDAEGDAAHTSFRTTLFRLRRSLGSDEAILFHEGQVSLDAHRVWVDTSAFRQLSAQGRKEDPSSLAGRAMELYRGDFLRGEEVHWVLSPRAKLRDRFLRLIVALGGKLEKEGQWTEACASYRAALDVDDLAEELYQRLMICHSRLGDKTAAISTYARLRDTLKARLDAKPSAKTEALYREVREETF
jgi:DNA-binding SARP family transcriptional activator